jgi:hypothetical protein
MNPMWIVVVGSVVTLLGGGLIAFLTWVVKQIMAHAVLLSQVQSEVTSTNLLANSTASSLAALTTATAAELARKVDEQAAQIAATAQATAAELARKVEATAAALARDQHPVV